MASPETPSRIEPCELESFSIEGHHTRPRDIERALANDLDTGARRDLQLEARSHVRVQKGIEEQYAAGNLAEPASSAFIKDVHRRFYGDVPSSMLQVHGTRGSRIDMKPGEFRSRADEDVVVGRHLPPSGALVPRFME